ncbi:hypothetical protein BSKO_03226 [Bryopsis sp. KO-2023]|nr:hypothetical protein BSKO_03226 [Bryopsis sp. KO-2023]
MSSGMENLYAPSVTVVFKVLLGCERMILLCAADQSVEVIYLRRRLKALRQDFKELQVKFVALRQRGNGAHARVESFLYRMPPTPSRRPKPTPPSPFVRWLRAICCLPPLPEEEEVWQGEGSWLLGVEAQRRGNIFLTPTTSISEPSTPITTAVEPSPSHSGA